MSTKNKYTKYVMVFAIIAILTFMWGCPAEIIPPIAVTEITVTGAEGAVTVADGLTLQMSAEVIPADAANPSVAWSVEAGTGVATINAEGLLTATAVGTVTVKAIANDGSAVEGTLLVTVTESNPITSTLASFTPVILTQTGDVANDNVQYADALAVIAALPAQIAVTLVDTSVKNIPLTWADTDTYDAAIAADYTFTAIWGAMPSGADNDGDLAVPTVKLTVVQGVLLVTEITVSAENDSIEVILEETLQMYASVLPITAADTSVSWSVAAGTGTATIDEYGLLTGTGEGSVMVKATANDSSAVEGTMEVTVNGRPFITSAFPVDAATGVAITTNIEATFNELMDSNTIHSASFIISASGSELTGAVSYDGLTKTATFNPAAELLYNTEYTATVTTEVTDAAGVALFEDEVWTFTTTSEALAGEGPALINLRTASNFAILAKAAITTTGNTLITGDIGVSPQALVDLTGFSETLSLDGTSATSAYVTGKIYASDMQEPTPSKLTTAITDVEAAYVEAAGRVDYAVVTGTAGGIIGGQTFVPGIYKWETVVTMATDITLQGGVNDVWIFQIADNLTASSGATVLLADGAQAKNIFWQVAGIVTLGTGSHFEGIIMSMTQIVLETGASVHGKLLAQTQVTLDTAMVTPL
ncbi:MAG: hypothetical protein CVV52_03595 [Spirochaetae bacterium HGW-Spirochaetae-8]|nr:MAG: hypothetical protein CVV52_03595 [Spirochaetae bacterium HGW-Spirochaetae-8]